MNRLFNPAPAKGGFGKSRWWRFIAGCGRTRFARSNGRTSAKESGVWVFDITATKSEAGVRPVPVHSKLAWLLKRRPKDNAGQVWPELKPGGPDEKHSWYYSKRFTELRGARKITGAKKVFHSLRKNVVRCLERARVRQEEAAEIIGHEKPGITYRVYNPDGMTMRQRRAIVEKIKYLGLKAPQLRWS